MQGTVSGEGVWEHNASFARSERLLSREILCFNRLGVHKRLYVGRAVWIAVAASMSVVSRVCCFEVGSRRPSIGFDIRPAAAYSKRLPRNSKGGAFQSFRQNCDKSLKIVVFSSQKMLRFLLVNRARNHPFFLKC